MNTTSYDKHYEIHPEFLAFVNRDLLPKVAMSEEQFWHGFLKIIDDVREENQALLQKRSEIQKKIDAWHKALGSKGHSFPEYVSFLKGIGYLEDEPKQVQVCPENIDSEISEIAGPQLVVPLKNARFALNAANARWGSLYDALYGSDCIEGLVPEVGSYCPERGSRVVEYCKAFLDEVFPLSEGSHLDVTSYVIYFNNLLAIFEDGRTSGLANNKQFFGHNGSKSEPESIFLENNGLKLEIQFNKNGSIGASDKACVDDMQVESALTSIMDCEDSVSAVDTEDKLTIYRNWLGLTEGNLKVTFSKNDKLITRRLQNDKTLTGRDGEKVNLPGRSLMLIRNVGLHMYSDMIVHTEFGETPEGIIDAVITTLIASLGLQPNMKMKNSSAGSIYIVKPKLHGPDEVAFSCSVFSRVENLLGLNSNTIKIGIMDEERRTSVNLKACIQQARERVFFINTGFLDRTGDEIHTSMHAGPFACKGDIKAKSWINAYEKNNVDVGLACGLKGKAQIGKGMWAMPDELNRMLKEKTAHPKAGASTAWVPSPTAASLHALHYHQINVAEVQESLKARTAVDRTEILEIPLMEGKGIPKGDMEKELSNNIQGILGYVVHWVNDGTGCSKIPDINNVGLMEDRATLRISCQHIANWLVHGICKKQDVEAMLVKMAEVVDSQNKSNSFYLPLLPEPHKKLAFQAASELIFRGAEEESGYTEAILHKYRLKAKSQSPNRSDASQTYQLSMAN